MIDLLSIFSFLICLRGHGDATILFPSATWRDGKFLYFDLGKGTKRICDTHLVCLAIRETERDGSRWGHELGTLVGTLDDFFLLRLYILVIASSFF